MIPEKLLKSFDSLPVFPSTVFKASEILGRGDYSTAELVDLIRYDPVMAANVVKMSNSAYFGLNQHVGSLREAVIFLGRDNLLKIIQTASAARYFKKKIKGYTEKVEELWEHSVAVALMSQILSKKIFNVENGRLYLTALLHDLGKLVMGEVVFESFDEISQLVSSGKYSFLEAEEEVVGINHAALGGKIAEKWDFPKEIVEAITFHHRPDLLENVDNTLVWFVYLADQACLVSGYTGGLDGLAHRGVSKIIEKFNFHEKDLELGLIELVEELKHAREVMGFI